MVNVMEHHAEPKRSISFSEQGELLDMNEILRHSVPQNDIGQEPVISSDPRSGEREIPGMLLVKAPSLKPNVTP